MKRLMIILMVIAMLLPSVASAQVLRPGAPKQFSVEVVEDENPYFILRWIDEESTITIFQNETHKDNLYIQVNFYVRYDDSVVMREMNFKYSDLEREPEGFSRIDLDLLKLGIVEEPVNLMFSSYNFRVRIGLAQRDILGSYTLFGSYSPPVTSGKMYPYNYASPWAIAELDKAHQYNLIPESISTNMRDVITREEFAEVMVAYYESKTGEEIDTTGKYFSDSYNPQVLKAAALGIITGYEDGTYRPENPITRQDIAVVITRTLQRIDTSISLAYNPLAIENGIKAYAYDSVMFLVDKGILKGDENNNLHPQEYTTREQAVMLTTRAYEHFE
ncbi:S-layer homology domain-containing protein [Gudongella sp. DL1XJH-153]|uniref:S-layer homology domain-containing protein n=1 Tax=Gudongella sp. DL1XJH-153 TaxID=3409804 RepID=UPI003BB4EB51